MFFSFSVHAFSTKYSTSHDVVLHNPIPDVPRRRRAPRSKGLDACFMDMKRDKVMIPEIRELVKAFADSIDYRISSVVTPALQHRNSVRMGVNDGKRALSVPLRSWAAEIGMGRYGGHFLLQGGDFHRFRNLTSS